MVIIKKIVKQKKMRTRKEFKFIKDISKVNFFVEKLLKINLKHLIKTIKNQYKILKIQCIVLIF